jgi:hypothetical protein
MRAQGEGTDVVSLLLPSWRFLLRQMERHLRQPPSLPRVHRLHYIVVDAPGLTRDSDKGFPVVQIYEVKQGRGRGEGGGEGQTARLPRLQVPSRLASGVLVRETVW